MADLATPAAPAPSAPAAAPSAPSAAPAAAAPAAAPAPVAVPVAPAAAAPAPAAAAAAVPDPAAPAAAPAAAKYDPATAAAPPKATDYPTNQEGNVQFMDDNAAWSLAHPEQAATARAERLAAEDNGILGEGTQAEAENAAAIKAAEGEQPPVAEVKPADAVAAPTPAKLEEWAAKSPELKAAFDKDPALRGELMEMARQNEAAKPVLDIVSTPEEAQFAVDHAQRLVSLQTNIMLAGDDPEQMGSAWGQVEEMFKERDTNGAEVKGADGKPVLGSDFKPFVRKAASVAMEDFSQSANAQIAALTARLAGNYPNDEARAADATLLETANYEKAAFDFVMHRMANPAEAGASTLPALPPNATPEQVAFQKQLETQQKELNEKQGKQTVESRRAASKTLDHEVQTQYEAGVNREIESHIAAMKERGEYLPEFVLTDKYINPATGQPTKVSAFGAKIYLALNAKINNNPLHAAKLGSLQALGAAGKDARVAEITRLSNLYLPKIIDTEVTRIQDGIRASSGQKRPDPSKGVARVEPQSAGTVVPAAMDNGQTRTWAEGEARKDPGFAQMDEKQREVLIMDLFAKKKYGG